MDTRLKKFKYSLFTKFLCWLIAICLFGASAMFALKIGINGMAVGFENYLKGDKISFFESYGFLNKLQQDFFACLSLADNNAAQLTKELQSKKNDVVKDALNNYLDYKASIIESELKYAVSNWDDSYYDYDGEIEVTIPEEYNTQVYVNIDDPESIQVAQKILVNAKGQEFLLYENLVRDSAFEGYYRPEESEMGEYLTIPLNLSKEDAQKHLSEQYDEYVRQMVEQSAGVSLDSLSDLESRKNLKYYVVDFDGNIYANIESIPQNLKNNDRYILANKGNHEVKGFALSNLDDSLDYSKYNVLCMYFDESFAEDDIYARLYNTFTTAKSENVWVGIAVCLLCFVLAIFTFVSWLSLVGIKNGVDEVKLSFADYLPTDIHLLGIGAIIYGLLVCLHDVSNIGTEYFDSLIFTNDFKVFLIAVVVAFLVIISEWLSSVVRIKKAGKSFFKQTLIFMLLSLVIKGIVIVIKKLAKIFEYKPRVFKWQFIAGCILFFLINALICLFITFAEWFTGFDGVFILLIGSCLLVFDLVVCFFAVKFMNNLDKIIVASGERKKISFGNERVGKALRTLAENLDGYNDALEDAVAEAVKNEQMKTQLITNVSHDLKTPLTSLINYSDLLGKCDITDEKALEYIDVINSQSIKLKRLIEDLIEASKASTGNVQLNKININLSELAVQAIVEFSAEFENNRIEVKFTEPESAPIVFADSVKTYRIISNLFSNAKKYSAPNSRVYVRVYEENGFGCFEIKNVSKEPLNISPELLTERFVRGDESRANEGNGLGLSIADDLCKLQGGSLSISIDGDLFKVIVKLPTA